MSEFSTSKPYKLRRNRETGIYEVEKIYEFLDQRAIGTLSVVIDGKPVSIPTIYARVGDRIVIHGSTASAILRAAVTNNYASLVTFELDRVILPDSIFYHSVDYRSVVVAGPCDEITSEGERDELFRKFSEVVLPGRYGKVREPNEAERRQTMVISIEIKEALYKFNETEDEVIDTSSETPTAIVQIENKGYRIIRSNNEEIQRDLFHKFLQ